ncbi:hypothetical protein Droror1_Dr00002496 [Drosera rotundifolia]
MDPSTSRPAIVIDNDTGLLSYAFTMEPDLFSAEKKMEVEASMVTVESPAIEEGTKVSEHPEELLVINYAILTNAIALPIIKKATVTDSSAPSTNANNNLVSFKKYNSDQSVDPGNWEVMSGNLAIHPYKAVAIRAVSSYQHKFHSYHSSLLLRSCSYT